jgi:DUF2950 family protein
MMSARAFRSKLLLAALMVAGFAGAATAQQDYPSPAAAADALAAAVKGGNDKSVLAVLGPGGNEIISSGDEVADKATRQRFIEAFDQKHAIEQEGDKKAVLTVGADDYPLPIPILRNKKGTWSFDTDSGRREILFRRIGRNELETIQSCLAYVDAQREYASKDRDGKGAGAYAERIVSSAGRKDGLYWPSAQETTNESPLGELFAAASARGYRTDAGHIPYHGYYYKVLTRQGPAAEGGPANYIVNGRMIGGFALVAYPATYRNSGVMTFIVNHAGTVYEKDLGPNTPKLAEEMVWFNPDQTWSKVDTTQAAAK